MNTPGVTNKSRVGLAVGALLLAGTMSMLFGWVSDRVFGHEIWTKFVLANFELAVGLPMAAALAFGIVRHFSKPLTAHCPCASVHWKLVAQRDLSFCG